MFNVRIWSQQAYYHKNKVVNLLLYIYNYGNSIIYVQGKNF